MSQTVWLKLPVTVHFHILQQQKMLIRDTKKFSKCADTNTNTKKSLNNIQKLNLYMKYVARQVLCVTFHQNLSQSVDCSTNTIYVSENIYIYIPVTSHLSPKVTTIDPPPPCKFHCHALLDRQARNFCLKEPAYLQILFMKKNWKIKQIFLKIIFLVLPF